MASREKQNNQTVAAKMPGSLVSQLDRMALYRGESRSSLIREIAQAAVDGRVLLGPPEGANGMSVSELAASDVGRAAALQARVDAAAACRGEAGALEGGAAAPDLDAVARATARRIARGRAR